MTTYVITFESMIQCFALCIRDKYKDSWGIFESMKNTYEDEFKQDLFVRGYLHGVQDVYQRNFETLILSAFNDLQETDTQYLGSMTILPEDYEDEVTRIVQLEDDSIKIYLHKLDGWKSESKYIIEMIENKKCPLLTSLSRVIMMIGNLIHIYGVDSQKYNEKVFTDKGSSGLMFQAMIYENMLDQLFNCCMLTYLEMKN